MSVVLDKTKKPGFSQEFIANMTEKVMPYEALGQLELIKEPSEGLRNLINLLNEYGYSVDSHQEFLSIYFRNPYQASHEKHYALFESKTYAVIVVNFFNEGGMIPVSVMTRQSFFNYVASLPSIYKHSDIWSNRSGSL